jgi:sugar-specific transcriptional regulator TrmB
MNEIRESLSKLGLTDKEALTYISLLELGESSAYALSKKSGLKKPTTYVVLEELRKKELVIKKPHHKSTLYVAKDPDELLHIAESNLKNVQDILPRLRAINRTDTFNVQTVFFDGLKETGAALTYKLDEIKNEELVGFYAYAENDKKFKEIYPYLMNWTNKMLASNITMRGITPAHSSLEETRKINPKFSRTIKEVPFEDYSSEVSIDVFGSIVRIVDLVEHQAVIIENPRVAKTVKQIFEMTWKQLP